MALRLLLALAIVDELPEGALGQVPSKISTCSLQTN